jgi:hypothetical protein
MKIQDFMKKTKLTDKPLTEEIVKNLGFRKKWLDDKSGYWWEKTLQGRIIPVNIVYDPDYNELTLRIKILNDFKPYKRESSWENLQVISATMLNLKRIIVNGVLINAAK